MTGPSVPLELPLGRAARGAWKLKILYRDLRTPLLKYLACLGLRFQEAQDIFQESFLALQQHLSAGGSMENPRGWLFRVARNRARNQQKSFFRRFATPLDPEGESLAHARTPERAAIERERARRLREGIRELSANERECLLLRAQGLRYREIGEVLDVPTSTVADVTARAIKKLSDKCHV
jgi:RNA polymerase sigma-70 factor, ECF subfamily